VNCVSRSGISLRAVINDKIATIMMQQEPLFNNPKFDCYSLMKSEIKFLGKETAQRNITVVNEVLSAN